MACSEVTWCKCLFLLLAVSSLLSHAKARALYYLVAGLSQPGQTARQLECLLTHVAALLAVLL